MDRREFLKLLGIAPVVPVVAALPVVKAAEVIEPVKAAAPVDAIHKYGSRLMARYAAEINREFVRENLFAPYVGKDDV